MSLSWVHISDLHFGQGSHSADLFDQKRVTKGIVSDAQAIANRLGSPDFVFITGDIAYSADSRDQYPAAARWIEELLDATGAKRNGLFVVPGNHDVDRAQVRLLLHSALRSRPEELSELFTDLGEMKVVWQKLQAFEQFAHAWHPEDWNPARPFLLHRVDTQLGPVVVIGLNTVLLSFDDKDSPTNLAIGAAQLNQAIESQPSNALLLVLQHHPPEWLIDGGNVQTLLARSPHLLFCGHVHQQNGFLRRPLMGETLIQLVAGAAHDPDHAGEHTYNWGRLSPDGLEYYPRAWSRTGLCFVDQNTGGASKNDFMEGVGRRVIMPSRELPAPLRGWLGVSPDAEPIESSRDDEALKGLRARARKHGDRGLIETMMVNELPVTDDLIDLERSCSAEKLLELSKEPYERYATSPTSYHLSLRDAYLIAYYLYACIERDDYVACRRKPFIYPVHQYLSARVRHAPQPERNVRIENLRRWLVSRQSVYETSRDFAAFELGMCKAAEATADLLSAVRNRFELPLVRQYGAMALGMIGDKHTVAALLAILDDENDHPELSETLTQVIVFIADDQSINGR